MTCLLTLTPGWGYGHFGWLVKGQLITDVEERNRLNLEVVENLVSQKS